MSTSTHDGQVSTHHTSRIGGPITLLAVGHACVDIYQGSVAALVPFFVSERSYTYAAASAIVLAASLLSSVVQPLFGALTDKWAMPWLLPVSTLVGGVGVALAGIGGSYTFTLAAVAASGVGVAAYHPESARVARLASHGNHNAMSWFSLGGNLGFAAAPLMVSGIIATAGLHASPLLVVPALVGTGLCVAALRRISTSATPTTHRTGDTSCRDDWASFAKLSGAIVCRSIVFVGLSAFISLYVRQRTGGGEVAGTTALFVLYLGGAVGTVTGGKLAARFGRLPVVRWSYALSILAVAGVIFVPGPPLYLFVALASAGLYVPFSLHITLGQDYLPGRIGTASGVTLGLTVSIGGLATPLIGALADATSLPTALTPLIALPAVGWLLLRTLGEPEMLEAANEPGPPQRCYQASPARPRPIPMVAGRWTACFTPRVYQLRAATDADIEFLTDVVIEATRDQGRLSPDFDDLEFRTRFSQWTAQQIADAEATSTTSVIEVDGQPVGRLRVVRTRDEIELAGIQLLPAQQSRGLGTRIITDLVREASDAGLTMTLSVEKDNPRAQALYRRLGFATTGETDKELAMCRSFTRERSSLGIEE